MKLVPFRLENGTMMAVNADRVDAIMESGGRTRIFAGDFYQDVTESFYTVFAVLQAKEETDGEQE